MADYIRKDCIIIPKEDYTDTLQSDLKEMREKMFEQMEKLKVKHNLSSLEIAHGNPSRILVFVNQGFIWDENSNFKF